MNKERKIKPKHLITALLIMAAIALLIVVFSNLNSSDDPALQETPAADTPLEIKPEPVGTVKPEVSARPTESLPPAPIPTATPIIPASPSPTAVPSVPTPIPTQAPVVQPTPAPTEEPHRHVWTPVYSTIQHEEKGHYETVIIREAYDEPVMIYMNICTVCGATGGNDIQDHVDAVHGGAGGYYADYVANGDVIHHDAITEQKWMIDTPAYTEQIISYYICHGCGDTRKLE